MIGRRLRRNCMILEWCEPPPVQSATCNFVYVLTPRVYISASKSVGTSRDEKLTKIPFIHPNLAWSPSRDITAVKDLLGVEELHKNLASDGRTVVRPFCARKAILLREALSSLKEKRVSFERLINRRKESDPSSRGTVLAERKAGLLRETEQTAESESPSRDARIA